MTVTKSEFCDRIMDGLAERRAEKYALAHKEYSDYSGERFTRCWRQKARNIKSGRWKVW